MGEELQRRMGERIREIREAKELSQEAMADEMGMHRTYIGSIERGERNPSLKVVAHLADLLGVSSDRLLCSHDHE